MRCRKKSKNGQKLRTIPKEEIVDCIKGIVYKFNEFGKSGEHIYDVTGESSIKEAIYKAVYHYLQCDLANKDEDINNHRE